MNSYSRFCIIFVSCFTLLRLVNAFSLELGVDEAHYALYGFNPALSYFDHPPLIGWVQTLFSQLSPLLGDASFRLAPIIIGVFISLLCFKFINQIFNSNKVAFYAVVALNSSFLISGMMLMFVPDSLLMLLAFLVINYSCELTKTNTWQAYLKLGVVLGLSGLSKYTAILFVPAIIIFILIKFRFDFILILKKFFNLKLLLMIIVALILIMPVLIWNFDNNFKSFGYQTAHVIDDKAINFKFVFLNILVQFISYSPLLFLLAFYGFYSALKKRSHDYLLLAFVICYVILLFFIYSSLFSLPLPHWNSIFYVFFIPLGVGFLIDKNPILTKILVKISLVFMIALHLVLIFKFNPFPNYNSIFRDIYGFQKIINTASSYSNNLAVTNWNLASRAIYYAKVKDEDVNVFLIDKRDDQFDIWQQESPLNKDLVFINTYFFPEDIKLYAKCDSYKELPKFDVSLNHNKVNTITLTKCFNYQGLQ